MSGILGSGGRPVLPEETDPKRHSLIQAMSRIFDGTPQRVDPGRMSVSALADEAGIPRNHLNRQYADLRLLFVDILAELERADYALPIAPEKVTVLESLVANQRVTIQQLQSSARDWKTAAEVFIRSYQALTIELANARRQLVNHARRNERQQETIERLGAAARDSGAFTSIDIGPE